ncbi:MAG: hypothetical protein UY03_C0007G0007 [Parcubacteria group bacterium GW2011_GWA2_47_64]|nr:MAG: hypothetical protein UY03_C0007G0007 [Parcubacteria group bacterium GW2011_GWA2_47_64]KKU96378.1 MAG: hypothetical protein UY29_C0013G0030 [Parcubacteria group bacterium GW2011_GWC2_48_17]
MRVSTWDMSGAQRLAIWRRAKAVLSKRKGALLKEYRKMRRDEK